MTYAEYQEHFENEADKNFNYYCQRTEDELLRFANKKQWDSTYQLWRAIGTIGTVKSIEPLFKIVSNLKVEYLIRYHAATALFKLAGIQDEEFLGMVQYGRNSKRQEINQKEAIEQLRTRLFNGK